MGTENTMDEFMEKNKPCIFENDEKKQARMLAEKRPYRAVFFDLDGTLLPMDIREFLSRYYQRLGQFIFQQGLDPEVFSYALNKGLGAMTDHGPSHLNSEAFWDTFFSIMLVHTDKEQGQADCERTDASQSATDEKKKKWADLLNRFYSEQFDAIGEGTVANPAAARAVETLVRKGYPLSLTTMPLFPREAVEARLRWSKVDPSFFRRITTYDNSTATKPSLLYFAENLAAAGVDAEDVLMVGNNTLEDLSFMELGADAFLVTDELLNPNGFDPNSVRHGSLEQFADWVETLPVCENPVLAIHPGPVDRALRDSSLKRYGLDVQSANTLKSVIPSMGSRQDVSDMRNRLSDTKRDVDGTRQGEE